MKPYEQRYDACLYLGSDTVGQHVQNSTIHSETIRKDEKHDFGVNYPILKVSLVSFLSKFYLAGVIWGAHRMSQCKQSCCISCPLLFFFFFFFSALDSIQQHSSELKPLHSFKLLGGSSWSRRVSSNSDTAKSNGCFSPWTICSRLAPPGWYFSCAWNDTVQVEIEDIEFRRSGYVRCVKSRLGFKVGGNGWRRL